MEVLYPHCNGTIPGIGDLAACIVLAEIGDDMSQFATHGHLISCRVVPRQRRECGQTPLQPDAQGRAPPAALRPSASQSDRPRRWLKTTLIQCAWAATRKKGSYPKAQYYRLRARRGGKKAIAAVAASMLTAAYHMLKDGTFYQDQGAEFFDLRTKAAGANKLVVRLQSLGYNVQISQPAVSTGLVSC